VTKARGFTLIEVLIALAIVAMALPALVLRIQSVSDNVGYIEEKTLAMWMAQNKMEELLIDYDVKKTFPKTVKHDRQEYGGKEWYWEVEAETTSMENLYRLTVRVGNDPEEIIASVAGFVREAPKSNVAPR